MAKDCGGIAATQQKQRVKFISSSDGYNLNNGIPAAQGTSSLLCITPATTTYEEVTKNILLFGQYNTIPGTNIKVPAYGNVTYKIAHTTGGSTTALPLYPFVINAECDMEMLYRKVGGENHLIVRLSNVESTLGSGGSNGTKYNYCGRGQYFGVYNGRPFAFALGVSAVPNPDAVQTWAHCLGGWKNDPTRACTSPCSYESMGGTWYDFGCKTVAPAFGNSRSPGRFNAGPYEFDLGNLPPKNETLIYVFGRMEWSLNRSNPCAGMEWRLDASKTANAYHIPPLNVCPPEVTGERQGRDICESCAIWEFDIAANDLLGTGQALLRVEYVWNATLKNVDWGKGEVRDFTINQDTPLMNQELKCLVGSSHYAYRMKIVLTNSSWDAESEYVYGEFDTLFIPPANMSVPDITESECVEIDSGNLIPPFEEIVCYGDCK